MLHLLLVAVLTVVFPVAAEPFWGATASQPVDADPATLKPGQFIWDADAVPSGPIVVVVSLPEQRADIYRNGVRIGVATVSTGKTGHQTPTGIFTVLQKDADHHSKKYNNAPMPYSERLTWDGVALHAGGLPGYPSSHGCVHLPSEFARKLFQISPMGMTVVIANAQSAPVDVTHPAALSPVDAKTGRAVEVPRLSTSEAFRWEPEKSPSGPLSIVVSGADQRVLVYRNGVEIGRAKVALQQPDLPLGTHAFIMQEGTAGGSSPIAPNLPEHRWLAIGLPGHAGADKAPLDPAQVDRVRMPPAFSTALYNALAPGTTLLVTDAPVLEEKTTGVALNVINADAPRID
ncbi:MAG: L,D-transpeptidase [Burkholderiales bacterium]